MISLTPILLLLPPRKQSLIFPPIQPTRTIDAPPRLLTNILPTILALDLPLDNLILTNPLVTPSDHEKTQRDQRKPQHLVQKAAVKPHHGPVRLRLLHRVVATDLAALVARPAAQDQEALVQVAGEEGEQGDDGEDDVCDEGVGDGCEGGGETGGGGVS